MESTVQQLENRVEFVKSEEPQYNQQQ
jgi:hypothetical protein